MTAENPSLKPNQMRLPFPETVSGFQDLAITEANRSAIEAIRKWKEWSHFALCLVGPPSSGLGITARLWAMEADASLLSADELDALSDTEIEALASRNCALDLADAVQNEAKLLTLLNLAQAADTRLLLTARSGGATWGAANADLKSRLALLPIAEIYPPDEEMVAARLLASCKSRFIKLNEATVAYLRIRLPRSYVAIEDYVHRLDQAISDTGKPASIHLAKTVLEEGISTRKLFDQDESD